MVLFWHCMGSHISQKWYEFTTGEPEIDRYGWVYRLVIENVDRCDWDYRSVIEIIDRYGRDYRLVIENVDRYGWDYRLMIENNGGIGPKNDWIIKTDDCFIFGVTVARWTSSSRRMTLISCNDLIKVPLIIMWSIWFFSLPLGSTRWSCGSHGVGRVSLDDGIVCRADFK